MNTALRLTVGMLLLASAAAFAAPGGNPGPPSQFPGNGNGPSQGWPHGGGGPGDIGSGGGNDGGFVPPAGTNSTVNTVPEPSTILLSIAALAVLAGVSRRR